MSRQVLFTLLIQVVWFDHNANIIFVDLQFVSIYAAYLYDSVMLYARALDLLLRAKANGGELTGEMIDEVAYNGTLIIETLVRNITYQSK